ncbi:ribosome biogenesis protein ytm1 [Neonectria magnoliae]|uniref:Ribosome biogenesis protein ytm1 n=1 Tax=Neonectria magnoliae TaxID=2732573 RepID=A0ABR1IH47_9HYPO
MVTPAESSQQLSDALVAFSLEGRFPDDISLLPPVSEIDLQPAIKALARAKKDLETELNTIDEETKEDAGSWARNHKSLQEDITRSRTIANEIIRQSEAPDVSGEAIEEVEEKATFLAREVQYSQQLHGVLRRIQNVNELLSEAETAKNERRILDSLRLLEKSRTALDEVGVSKTCRVMKLFNIRSSELRSAVHEVFDHVWKALVHVDIDTRRIAVYNDIKDEQMNLTDAVLGLKQFKEVDERIEQLWHNVDAAIVSPRMNTRSDVLPNVQAQGEVLQLTGQAEQSVEALLSDLETVMVFLNQRLPPDLLPSLGKFMMADVIPRLVKEWLNPAVPSSLKEMGRFQATIQRARVFCEALERSGYDGFDELQSWVDNAPSIWLGKCRETTLDTVRSRLLGGIGESIQVEKVEKQLVSISEGKKISKTSEAVAPAETNDWGDAWGEDWDEDKDQASNDPKPEAKDATKTDEDDGADAWGGWDEEETTAESSSGSKVSEEDQVQKDGDDGEDSAAAWGWGDEDTTEEPERESAPASKPAHPQEETRELVLRETYNISSLPEPVLELISAILEDGAKLTREDNEDTTVAATAPGLFGIPTFALALFRAISPYYYSFSDGGNMFLYNDATYLAEKLSEFSETWKKREDLSSRAKNMLRLDNDIKSLQSFANRSYSSEMNIQKTVLRDLIGGSQSLMQQDETKACIESGTARIRSMAAIWEPILARSVWTQAIGSLADTLATKLITDVLEMPSIGQDEAYNIAKLIATATELDDLFPPKSGEGDHPRTAQFAPSWLRLKYLSEVLQSNLNEIRYLWFESELSVHFTATEVIDLIEASFEANARTKETIREIQTKPAPLAR